MGANAVVPWTANMITATKSDNRVNSFAILDDNSDDQEVLVVVGMMT